MSIFDRHNFGDARRRGSWRNDDTPPRMPDVRRREGGDDDRARV